MWNFSEGVFKGVNKLECLSNQAIDSLILKALQSIGQYLCLLKTEGFLNLQMKIAMLTGLSWNHHNLGIGQKYC